MNVHIFSYPINNFKILLKLVITSNLFCSSSIFLSHKSQVSHIQSIRSRPLSGHASKDCFKTRKSRDGVNTTLTTNFFTWLREKKYLCSEQLKQPFYSLIHSKMIETCYEDTTQTTTFWILAETFYIPFTFYNFNNQFIGWKWKF